MASPIAEASRLNSDREAETSSAAVDSLSLVVVAVVVIVVVASWVALSPSDFQPLGEGAEFRCAISVAGNHAPSSIRSVAVLSEERKEGLD